MITNPRDVLKAASQLNDSFVLNEKFPLPLLAAKARKAALNDLGDQSIRVLSTVLTKMSENGKIFITRGEFKNICSKFASTNSSINDYFSEELGPQAEAKPDRPLAGQATQEHRGLYSQADSFMSNALSDLWDSEGKINKEAKSNLFDPLVAKQAQKLTNLELTRLGVSPKNVNVFAGTDSFIICDASYETPKGESHLLIPVEISKSGALIPNLFVSKHGLADLSRETVKQHVLASAGRSFNVNSKLLIDTLNFAKQASTMSEFEIKALALQDHVNNNKIRKTASNRMEMPFSDNGIFIKEIDSNKSQNVMMQMPKAPEFEKFASSLSSERGKAEFIFGQDIINNTKRAIISKVASFGYSPQVSVASCDKEDDIVVYAVRVDTPNGPAGFEVMAEMHKDKAVLPSIISVADKAYDFTSEGIASITRSNYTDYKTVATVSPLYELKSTDILENIRTAANNGDFKSAEEALLVLAEKGNQEVYSQGLAEYMRSVHASSNLSLKKQAAQKSGCTRMIKVSTHSNPVCGHLNVPLDQVYQNEHGECVPKYRKNMTNTYEGAFFNTSKIFG
ncbi:MAG: hypothetical protein ACOYMA_00265 [Bacteroidia bacterium]